MNRPHQGGWESAGLWLALFVFLAASIPSGAQVVELSAEDDEAAAYEAAMSGKYVRARELATEILASRPAAPTAQLALSIALHEGEGNIPLALHHYRQGRALVEGPAGLPMAGLDELHRLILFGEWRALSDLGRYEELLEVTATIRRLYDRELHSLDVWPLMKLGRVDDARAAIDRALATGDPYEELVARNGLCAIEGYPACQAMLRAVEREAFNPGLALRNAAVSAVAFGKIEEAERLLLESTRHPDEETNPWRDLADLYMEEARLAEAAGAAREMVEFGRSLPPREQQNSHGKELVSSAKLLLLLGETADAMKITQKALDEPARAAHWSGDRRELAAEGTLLYRSVRRTLAEEIAERAAFDPWYTRPGSLVARAWHRSRGWLAARRTLPMLLEGGLRLAPDPASRSAPDLTGSSWLILDAVELFGAGAALDLVASVREELGTTPPVIPEKLFSAQLDAIAAEASYLAGDEASCLRSGRAARSAIPRGLVLLRARLAARMAECADRSGRSDRSGALYEEVLSSDPGALRRLGQSLPVRVESGGAAAWTLVDSPRFRRDDEAPFALVGTSGGELCLIGPSGGTVACSGNVAPSDRPAHVETARALSEATFSPSVDLSQQDLGGLDGSPLQGRSLDLGLLKSLSEPRERPTSPRP